MKVLCILVDFILLVIVVHQHKLGKQEYSTAKIQKKLKKGLLFSFNPNSPPHLNTPNTKKDLPIAFEKSIFSFTNPDYPD